MNGASALPMIWLAEWFSMTMTKMWSNAGTVGTAAVYAASRATLGPRALICRARIVLICTQPIITTATT
jgi:hypothetical protein